MDRIHLVDQKYYIENDFILRRISHAAPVEPHTHDFMEFVYMQSGKSLHTVNGVEYPMSSGDLLLVNYGEVHCFTADPQALYMNILIKPALLDQNLADCQDLFYLFEAGPFRGFKELVNDQCRYIRFSPEEKDCFEYMLLLLEKELHNREVGFDLTTRAGVDFLLTMIFRKMRKNLLAQTHEFKQVLDYIEENYAQDLNAGELAKLCHYNSAYFSRVFRKHTGLTFTEYIKRLRIRKACAMLQEVPRTGKLYILVGYTNKTTFYKHFREVTGMTPLEYKKETS